MSKSKSRGWLQVIARNPSANPHTDPHIQSERNSAQVVARRAAIERRDFTRFPLDVQFDRLTNAIECIQMDLVKAVHNRQVVRTRRLVRLLANQQSAIEAIANRMAAIHVRVEIDTADGHVVRPDLTVNYDEMVRKFGPNQRRWGIQYVNKRQLVTPLERRKF